jgi:hypothetical protein
VLVERKRLLHGLLLSIIALGCSDATEPEPDPFDVAFTHTVSSTGWNSQTSRHECQYTLTARASGGEADAYAGWLVSEWQFWFDNGTRSTYTLDLVDMLDYWGSDRIVTGETQRAHRIAWSSVPFELAYTFRYLDPDGRFVSKPVFLDCH